jgi:hypothetical protein
VDTAAAWNSALGRHLWLEACAGGIRFERHAARTELTLAIDNEVPRWGFHPSEGDPGAGWSWIGPRPRAGLILPGLAARLDVIRLHAVATASVRIVDELQVALDGEPAHVRRHWQGTTGTFEVTPSSRRTAWLPLHRLDIVCPETLRPNADERGLALALASVTLSTRQS